MKLKKVGILHCNFGVHKLFLHNKNLYYNHIASGELSDEAPALTL
jgi:hypothetical protein